MLTVVNKIDSKVVTGNVEDNFDAMVTYPWVILKCDVKQHTTNQTTYQGEKNIADIQCISTFRIFRKTTLTSLPRAIELDEVRKASMSDMTI